MKSVEVAAIALAVALVNPTADSRAATLKTVALQNDPSPEPSYFYKKFEKPDISDAAGERVAVFASAGAKKCIFSIDPDSDPDSTVACRRDSTPDGHAFTQMGRKLGDVSINVASTVAWAARVSSGQRGVFRSGPTFVADIGDLVPAPGTGLLQSFSYARISDANDVVFVATISGGAVVLGVTVNQGIFRCSGGNGNCSPSNGGLGTLSTLVLLNDAVPDRPGRRFCKLYELDGSTFGTTFRASTQLDCASTLEVPAVGIFRRAVAGPIVTIALEGEPCQPSTAPGGTTYAAPFGPPAIANTGMVAFQARTAGLFVNNILYLCDSAGCPPAPATDAVAQGQVDDDGNIFRTFSAPGVSNVGDIGFSARLSTSSGTRYGLYLRRPTNDIETVVLSSVTPVPGASPPAVFRQPFLPSVSSGGKLAFAARIRRTVAPRNLRGVFVFESPSGAFLDVDPGS